MGRDRRVRLRSVRRVSRSRIQQKPGQIESSSQRVAPVSKEIHGFECVPGSFGQRAESWLQIYLRTGRAQMRAAPFQIPPVARVSLAGYWINW
jgi:hypothetical protein